MLKKGRVQTELYPSLIERLSANDCTIVLASASPRRREILEEMGFSPVIRPACTDEDTGSLEPEAAVKELSRRKCLALAEQMSARCIVIGADTIVEIDGRILGKPKDEDEAGSMIGSIRGRFHNVFTGVTICAVESGEIVASETFAERTRVHVTSIDEAEMKEYIKSPEPYDKAGAYGIQGMFGKYIDRIEGDYFNVVGLPKAAVYASIKRIAKKLCG